MLETADALRRAGHEVVEFVPPDGMIYCDMLFETPYSVATVAHALELFAGITSADGYQGLLSHLGPDPQV